MIIGLGDTIPDALHLLSDLLRSFCGLADELIDFGRHNREPASGFNCACSLNLSIQGQQVRAFCDLPDRIDNFANPVRVIGQAGYRFWRYQLHQRRFETAGPRRSRQFRSHRFSLQSVENR